MSDIGRLIVVKVGGSLMDWPPLPDRLSRFLQRYANDRVVLVCGGGGAADWVRALDRVYALGEEAAHHLAVRSLDFSAHALSAILQGSNVVTTEEELAPCWKSGRVPILAPRLVLDDNDRSSDAPLPRNWDATTDSISARLATILNADELVLIKSVTVAPGTTPDEMSRNGVVDPLFPKESRSLTSIFVVNLRDVLA